MTKAQIIGIGAYAPKRILTNEELERMVDTSSEWIVQRTGIRERHVVDVGPGDQGRAAGPRARGRRAGRDRPDRRRHHHG
jgi:3-oxoacyl-[acyl-carrier-protein] synthase-3